MPSHFGGRPLKSWRYVAVFCDELMLCLAQVRIGRARQSFWAVWDRSQRRLHERTAIGWGRVELEPGRGRVRERETQIYLELDENAGVETICRAESAYAWTRKQGGIAVRGRVMLDGRPREIEAHAVVDDTAGYYPRHTRWYWSAGVGVAGDGNPVAWNLVSGVNDPPRHSERTVWVAGEPYEPPPCCFSPDLTAVDELRFTTEAVRRRRENLLLVRSDYRQPFGTFSGRLPAGPELTKGLGVMESHDAWW